MKRSQRRELIKLAWLMFANANEIYNALPKRRALKRRHDPDYGPSPQDSLFETQDLYYDLVTQLDPDGSIRRDLCV